MFSEYCFRDNFYDEMWNEPVEPAMPIAGFHFVEKNQAMEYFFIIYLEFIHLSSANLANSLFCRIVGELDQCQQNTSYKISF